MCEELDLYARGIFDIFIIFFSRSIFLPNRQIYWYVCYNKMLIVDIIVEKKKDKYQ